MPNLQELKPAANIDDMLAALKRHEDSTYFEADDLKGYTYERDSEFGSLNKHQKKLTLTFLSLRHLCKLIGVPNSVFSGASPSLSNDLLQEFMAQKKDDQTQRKLALKRAGNKTLLRGLLPLEYADVRNSELLAPFKQWEDKMVVQSAGWMDEADAPLARTRIVFKDTIKDINGDTVYIGLDVTGSELAAGPLQAAILLYRLVCANGAIGVYDRKPYFYYDYGGVLAVDMGTVMETVVKRMNEDMPYYFDSVNRAMSEKWDKQRSQDTLERMIVRGDLNKGVGIKVDRILVKDPPKTRWDFVNAITSMARGYRDILRMRYEQAAGTEMGLTFPRRREDPDWLVSLAPKSLPASIVTPAMTQPAAAA